VFPIRKLEFTLCQSTQLVSTSAVSKLKLLEKINFFGFGKFHSKKTKQVKIVDIVAVFHLLN
jgi:hypothetical protein